MQAAILSIGDEVVQGRILDTNARGLAGVLEDAGMTCVHMETVGDGIDAIKAGIAHCAAMAPLVLTSGGLGPTDDDRTRDALCALAQQDVVRDAAALEALRERLARVKVEPTEAQCRQADRPEHMVSLPNSTGTAPGITGMLGDSRIFVLPGPPGELKPMVQAHVLPALAGSGNAMHQHQVSSFGLAEAPLAALLGQRLQEGHDPATGIRVSGGVIHVHLRSADAALLARDAAMVRDRIGRYALPNGCDTPADALTAALVERDWRIATAESCTGGAIGAALTDRAGSSAWYVGGLQTYTDEAKVTMLQVPEQTLRTWGAVSGPVVEAMARGAAEATRAECAVAVSGIAGPDGGTPAKPVGTVWIGSCVQGDVRSRCVRLPGPRARVRAWTVHAALQHLRWQVEGIVSTLRWDVQP